MRLPCPFCGDRDAAEFTYRGDAAPRRPPAEADADAWHDYVYDRDNPAGPMRELWFHRAGCQGWIVVERDTRTHAVTGAAEPSR
jgi:heterotetrameric sarcosine oxidase delta subunit